MHAALHVTDQISPPPPHQHICTSHPVLYMSTQLGGGVGVALAGARTELAGARTELAGARTELEFMYICIYIYTYVLNIYIYMYIYVNRTTK